MLIIIPLLLFGILLYHYFDWRIFNYSNLNSATHRGGVSRLTWNTLANFYVTNPKRFRYETICLEDYNLLKTSTCYLIFNSGSSWTKTHWYNEYYDNSDKIVRIQLSFLDFLKFKWKRKHLSANSGGGTETIINAVNRDIKAKREIAKKQMEQATKEIKEIAERLNNK